MEIVSLVLIQMEVLIMSLIELNKEELCLISIALNEYQLETDNYHLDEMRKVSSRIDNLYNNLSSNKEVINHV